MKSCIRVLAIAVALLGLAASPATAGVIQSKTLTAKAGAQTWESTDRGNPSVHVYRGGREIEQTWIDRCRGNYVDRDAGLYVWVRVKNCATATAANPQPYVIRFLSVAGPQPFRVTLTTGGAAF
jgi:hypothetical protein